MPCKISSTSDLFTRRFTKTEKSTSGTTDAEAGGGRVMDEAANRRWWRAVCWLIVITSHRLRSSPYQYADHQPAINDCRLHATANASWLQSVHPVQRQAVTTKFMSYGRVVDEAKKERRYGKWRLFLSRSQCNGGLDWWPLCEDAGALNFVDFLSFLAKRVFCLSRYSGSDVNVSICVINWLKMNIFIVRTVIIAINKRRSS